MNIGTDGPPNKYLEIPRGYRNNIPRREDCLPYLRSTDSNLESVDGLVAGLVPLWLSNQWGCAPYSELVVIPLSELKRGFLAPAGPGSGKSSQIVIPLLLLVTSRKQPPTLIIKNFKWELGGACLAMAANNSMKVLFLEPGTPELNNEKAYSGKYNPLSFLCHPRTKKPDLARMREATKEITLTMKEEGDIQDFQLHTQLLNVLTAVLCHMTMIKYRTGVLPAFAETYHFMAQGEARVKSEFQAYEALPDLNEQAPGLDKAETNFRKKIKGVFSASITSLKQEYLDILMEGLAWVLDEEWALFTESSTFTMEELIKVPHAIFFGIGVEELPSYRMLNNLLDLQMLREWKSLARQKQGQTLERPALFIIDEAGQARIRSMPRDIAVARSMNISFEIFFQTKSQLRDLYGENGATAILYSTYNWYLMPGMDGQTAKEVSDMISQSLEKYNKESVERHLLPTKDTETTRQDEIWTPVFFPWELTGMPKDEAHYFIRNILIPVTPLPYYELFGAYNSGEWETWDTSDVGPRQMARAVKFQRLLEKKAQAKGEEWVYGVEPDFEKYLGPGGVPSWVLNVKKPNWSRISEPKPRGLLPPEAIQPTGNASLGLPIFPIILVVLMILAVFALLATPDSARQQVLDGLRHLLGPLLQPGGSTP